MESSVFGISVVILSLAMKIEKQIMMVVQAAPKTHPGGVHGALFKLVYHSELTPEFVNRLPRYKPPKFITRKISVQVNIKFLPKDSYLTCS